MSSEHTPMRDAGSNASHTKLTGTVDEAARILGIGRNACYEAIKRNEIPNRRVGHRIIVLWQPFMRMLDGEAA